MAQAVPMNVGYGENGHTAQVSWVGPLWKTDREIMQHTVFSAKKGIVNSKGFCDNWRRSVTEQAKGEGKSGKRRRVAFPREVWEEVMKAGLIQYPVGRLENAGNSQPRVVFSAPPTGDRDAQVIFHNMLMDLCQISGRRFSSLLVAETGGEHAVEEDNE
eukprot:9527575-Karenia_brevis.AAC.1